MKTGFIYAVRCSDRIKIGFSTRPEFRFSKIASDAPFPCEYLGCWPGTEADELAAHEHLAASRTYREWFADTAMVTEYVRLRAVPEKAKKRHFEVVEGDLPLAVWRKTSRLTLKAVGDSLGVDKCVILRWERGQVIPRQASMQKLVEITNGAVSPSDWYESRAAA